MNDRAAGLLLFLPVPIVLVLFTQAPLGAYVSLGLGVTLMVTHRLYARPFALRRAGRRCLWCGEAVAEGAPPLDVVEPLGETAWRACGSGHLSLLRRTLGWAAKRALLLKVGILGSLVGFLVIAPFAHADAASLFRLGVAVTVLPFGLFGTRGSEALEPPLPFPVHIQALIGTAAVLWLFRIVGVVWLALALVHAARRTGLVAL